MLCSALLCCAGQARLTLATTHHAELKSAADDDLRYVNACMEFDIATLSPTYHLTWGLAGASNAIAIAQALGFDSKVVKEARSLVEVAQQAAEERSKMSKVSGGW